MPSSTLSAIYPLSSHKETRDYTRRLPVELFTYTLDLLAQPDVLRAAGVCRRWRAIAIRHSNFYRHIAYGSPAARWWYCDSAPLTSSCQWQQPMFWRSARAFQRSVDEALTDGHGVRISVRVQVANCPRGSVVFATSLDRKVHDTLVGIVIPALARSLPLACNLHLEIPTVFGEMFMRALSGSKAEAPVLRRVYLYAEGGGGSSTVEIPTQILGGRAPKLRSLACEGPIVWPSELCPAFSRVTTVECPVGPTFFANALRLFPHVVHLVCDMGRLSQITGIFVAQHKEAILELLSQLHSLRLTVECDLPSSCTNKGGLQLVELVSNHSRTIRDVHICLRGVEVDRFPPIRGLFEATPAPCVLAVEKASSPALGNLSRHSELYYRDFANPTASMLLEMNALDGNFSRIVEVHSVTPAAGWLLAQVSPAGDAIVKLRVWHGYLEANLPFFASLPRVAELEVDVRSSPPTEWNPEKRVRSRELGRILAAIWKRAHGDTSPIPRGLGDAALHCDLSRDPSWPSLHTMRLFNSDVTRKTSVRCAQLVAFAHVLGLCDPRRPMRPALHIATSVVEDSELPQSLKEYFSEIRRNVTLCV